MKTLPLAILTSAIVLASCSSSRYAASSDYDDVYYSPAPVETQVSAVAVQPAVTPESAMNAQPVPADPVYIQSPAAEGEALSDYELYRMQREAEMLGETYEPEGSEGLYAQQYQEYDSTALIGEYGQESAPVIVNNYNYYNDPYDYYYSSNLRRFSDAYYGWDYYDPYYTDLYFYTGRSMHWGMSIGWGYPYWGMRYSYGYPYYYDYYNPYAWGWGGYYDPWYSSWGYGGYYGGYYPYYRSSYWSGFYSGYNYGYWNSRYYDSGNYLYGRLDSRHYYGYTRPGGGTLGGSKGSTYVDPKFRSRTGTTESLTGDTRTNRTVNAQSAASRTTATRTDQVRSDAATRTNAVRTNTTQNRTQTGTVRTTRTTQPANVQQRNTPASRGTYTPSYSKPRTSSTPSFNSSPAPTRNYSQPSAPVNRSTTINRSGSSISRPGSSSGSSSSFNRPSSSTSRSSSSFSRPSSSTSRSSSSFSRPSSSSSRSSGSSISSSSSSSSRSSGSSVSRSSSSSSSRSSSGSSSRGSIRR